MSSTILAAVIGGLCTILAAIIAVFVTRFLDNPMGFQKGARHATLEGYWEGTICQEGMPGEYQMTLQLKPVGRTVRANGYVSYISPDESITEPVTAYGGFLHDRFLKLEYEMQTLLESVQFGYSLYELSPNGQILNGAFLGYGALTKNLVRGTIELHRRGYHPSSPRPILKTP